MASTYHLSGTSGITVVTAKRENSGALWIVVYGERKCVCEGRRALVCVCVRCVCVCVCVVCVRCVCVCVVCVCVR